MRRKTRTKIQKIFQTKILLENIRASDFIDADFIDTNIATEVNNSIQDSSHSIDFAVTDSNKINIIKTISDGFETMPVKNFIDPKDIINQRKGKLSKNRKVKVPFFPSAKLKDKHYYSVFC